MCVDNIHELARAKASHSATARGGIAQADAAMALMADRDGTLTHVDPLHKSPFQQEWQLLLPSLRLSACLLAGEVKPTMRIAERVEPDRDNQVPSTEHDHCLSDNLGHRTVYSPDQACQEISMAGIGRSATEVEKNFK